MIRQDLLICGFCCHQTTDLVQAGQRLTFALDNTNGSTCFKSVNQWPLCMCADFGPKWQGSVSWKCHFKRDFHQASSCHRDDCLTAWCVEQKMCRHFLFLCFENSLFLLRFVPALTMTIMIMKPQTSCHQGLLLWWKPWRGQGVQRV